MTEWNDLAERVLVAGAPTLGAMLGGLLPIPGGSLLGQTAGEIIARSLGVPPQPDAIAKALMSDPDAGSILSLAEREAMAKWPALAEMARAESAVGQAQVVAVNEAIRAEAASGDGLLGRWRGSMPGN